MKQIHPGFVFPHERNARVKGPDMDHEFAEFLTELAAELEDNISPDQWTGNAVLHEAAPSFEWQETEAWLPAPPASHVESASEMAALQAAIRSGQRSENVLADLVFYRRHPERNQRPLSATEPDFARLSQEWLQIRDTLVRPLMGGAAPPRTTPPAGTPAGPARPVSGGSAIRWATNANSAAVPAYAQRVLTDIVRSAGLTQILVSSTQRTPADQARVMFNNCRQFGPQSQLNLYGSVGDRVIQVYIDSKAAGRTDAQIMADMERKIIELGPPNVSRHTADPKVLAVIDIAPSSVTNKAAFERAVKADSRVSLFLQPPQDPAYHVEIPIPR